MKTAKQFAEEYYNLIYNNYGSLQDLEDYFIEYGKQLLIEASKRANIILKDVYSEDFTIVNDEIVRYNPRGVSSVYADECTKFSIKINSESILNIINELK